MIVIMANVKLLPHKHTGRLRSHQHTSYGGLFIVLVLAMLPILFSGSLVSADNSYGVYAQVPPALPSVAPKITNIAEGKVYVTNDSVQATGTCENNTQVKIFKNGILGGSTLCKVNTFSLTFELFIGSNSLTVRSYNTDNIAGPESSPISVKLVPSNTTSGAVNTNNQLFITSDAYYRGASSGKAITWLLTVAGGQAPYVVSISWGDGQTEEIGRGTAGQFKISHIYSKPPTNAGNYTVVIKAKDLAGDTALLQLVAVIPNGILTAVTNSSNGGGFGWFTTKIALQTLVTTTLIVFSFWIGERYEFRLLKRQHVSFG
jgi:hypothetical protein